MRERFPFVDVTKSKDGVTERVLQNFAHGHAVHEISGPARWVDLRVEQLFNQYHPCGYSTRVVKNIERDGEKHVVIERADSCD